MITLYMNTGCPYCEKVERALKERGLAYAEKNISDGEPVVAELIAKGGKRQVPFFVDDKVAMYESDDIVAHIEKTYRDAQGDASPRVTVVGGHCDASGEKGGCTF